MGEIDLKSLAAQIVKAEAKGKRRLVAITGAPASGKSTIAEKLQTLVPNSAVVPMDGFHLDNSVLRDRNLRSRKGAPHTFDVDGFVAMIGSLRDKPQVSYPLFDRERDTAIAEAGKLGKDIETVLVEGNYLMLRSGGWEALQGLWDVTIMLEVPMDELERRLEDRWSTLGLPRSEIIAKIHGNDLINARKIASDSFPSDLTI